jgi:hypothetical protein
MHSDPPIAWIPNDDKIAAAREIVLAWLARHHPGSERNPDDVARSFCLLLPPAVKLELRTSYNPSALVYEARWYHEGRLAEEFPKPFCAEAAADAGVLACAAMINLPD